MNSTRLFSLALTALCCCPVVASAQPGPLPVGRPVVWDVRSGTIIARTGQRLRVKRPPAKPVWKIPQGKYGLQIKDGLRMIGRPAKDWSATLKTDFGTVTIPLAKITKLEPAANGQFAAHLKNGDRVTGALISKKLPFETEFGTLNVPSSDLVRLSTATVVIPTAPKSTGMRRTSTRPVPPKVILDGTESVLPVFRR